MLVRRVSRIIFDKRAVNKTVSATILTGAVIALSLAVSGYDSQLGETVNSEMAKLKEKLVFEYVSCGNPPNSITIYLLSCGTIENLEIKNVCVSNNSWLRAFSTPPLYFLNGTSIPDQDLDVGEEGYLVLLLSTSLSSGYYNVKVVTGRGAAFDSNFVV